MLTDDNMSELPEARVEVKAEVEDQLEVRAAADQEAMPTDDNMSELPEARAEVQAESGARAEIQTDSQPGEETHVELTGQREYAESGLPQASTVQRQAKRHSDPSNRTFIQADSAVRNRPASARPSSARPSSARPSSARPVRFE